MSLGNPSWDRKGRTKSWERSEDSSWTTEAEEREVRKMPRITKAIRILEYVGPEDWIELTLERGLVTEEDPLWECSRSTIRQVSLTKEEVE